MSQRIAQRYTQALHDFLEEHMKDGSLPKDISFIRQLIETSKELVEILESPTISSEDRLLISQNIFNWLNILLIVCEATEESHPQKQNMLCVKVTTSIPLEQTQIHELSKQLQHKFKAKIKLQLEVDPLILGGMKIQAGDTVYDHSFSGKIERFKKKL